MGGAARSTPYVGGMLLTEVVDQQPRTYRWVADDTSVHSAARAFQRAAVRRPRWWLRLLLIEVVLAYLIADAFGSHHGRGGRVVFGLVEALLPTMLIAMAILGATQRATVRRLLPRLTPGVALESSFGPTSIELRGPRSETTLPFRDLDSIARDGEWVRIAVRGSPDLAIWPGALFPPDELERVREGIGAAAPSGAAG